MLRVQADEALGGRTRGFGLCVLVVGVDQLELRLLGIAAERIAGLQCLQFVDGIGVALVVEIFLRLLVKLVFAQVFIDLVTLGRAGGDESEGGDQQQVFHLHGGLHPWTVGCRGRCRLL
ncbi:hypothetical protein D3C76_1291020 [compost metagenome]